MSTMVNGNKTFLALWVALGLRLILWIFIIALVIALVTMVWVRAISRRKIAYPVGLEVLSEAEDIEIEYDLLFLLRVV
jgi:hypothetical protein